MSNPGFVINDPEWADDIQRGVEEYTDMLFEAMWETSEEGISETLSGELFCGCGTCLWREAMTYITPKLFKGFEEGKIELED